MAKSAPITRYLLAYKLIRDRVNEATKAEETLGFHATDLELARERLSKASRSLASSKGALTRALAVPPRTKGRPARIERARQGIALREEAVAEARAEIAQVRRVMDATVAKVEAIDREIGQLREALKTLPATLLDKVLTSQEADWEAREVKGKKGVYWATATIDVGEREGVGRAGNQVLRALEDLEPIQEPCLGHVRVFYEFDGVQEPEREVRAIPRKRSQRRGERWGKGEGNLGSREWGEEDKGWSMDVESAWVDYENLAETLVNILDNILYAPHLVDPELLEVQVFLLWGNKLPKIKTYDDVPLDLGEELAVRLAAI